MIKNNNDKELRKINEGLKNNCFFFKLKLIEYK